MKFNFQFGNKPKTIWDYAFWSIVLFSLIGFLSTKFKVGQDVIWQWLDQIQRELVKKHLLPQDNIINDFTIKTPQFLNRRIKNDVDAAIRDYEASIPPKTPRMKNKDILTEIEKLKYTNNQRIIVKDAIYYECPNGVMGIRGAWVEKDPECIDK
jgi:hypothetical protein